MSVENIRIVIIRHGRTRGNDEGRYIGCRSDEPLSEEGINEIIAARSAFSTLFDEDTVVFSSPMKRAVDTACLLFSGMVPITVGELKETDFGCFEGHNHAELDGNAAYQRFIDSRGEEGFPQGESRDEFIQRTMQGFHRILYGDRSYRENSVANGDETKNTDNFAIVCHGGNIMAVMSELTGRDYYDFHVPCLDGYILELRLDTDNERILDLTYNRIGAGMSG
ncbi:MAG: histidine phosphatase family protein [Lachnospiraceae bacterium]|nr:histidine phosphatase family protein [Lachnospiraceae bacterium]